MATKPASTLVGLASRLRTSWNTTSPRAALRPSFASTAKSPKSSSSSTAAAAAAGEAKPPLPSKSSRLSILVFEDASCAVRREMCPRSVFNSFKWISSKRDSSESSEEEEEVFWGGGV